VKFRSYSYAVLLVYGNDQVLHAFANDFFVRLDDIGAIGQHFGETLLEGTRLQLGRLRHVVAVDVGATLLFEIFELATHRRPRVAAGVELVFERVDLGQELLLTPDSRVAFLIRTWIRLTDWVFNGTSTQKGQFVPTACEGGKPAQSAVRMANEIQSILPYVTR